MDKQTRVTWAERAVKAVKLAFPDPEDVTLWDHCERLLPHALVCASLIEAYSLEFAKASVSSIKPPTISTHALNILKLNRSTSVPCLAIYEKVYWPEHPFTATSFNNLAGLYPAQGKYEQAEPLYQRALAIVEKQLGSEHYDTATIRENYHTLRREMQRKGKRQH